MKKTTYEMIRLALDADKTVHGADRQRILAEARGLDPGDRLLSSEEVSNRIGVHPNTVYNWAKQGILPPLKVSRKTHRYRLRDVLWLEEAWRRGVNGDALVEAARVRDANRDLNVSDDTLWRDAGTRRESEPERQRT